MFSSDRQYKGDLYCISGENLSKYAQKHLQLTHGYGFVNVTEKYPNTGKIKVDVYYLDFAYPTSHVNYISTEIVDENDIYLMDWSMVMNIYNNGGHNFIVENYLHYLEVYNTSAISWGCSDGDNRHAIYNWPDCFDEGKAIKIYESFNDLHTLGKDWMIQQVETGKINLDEIIKKLKSKYYDNIQCRNQRNNE